LNIIGLKWLKTLSYSLSVDFVGNVGDTPKYNNIPSVQQVGGNVVEN